MTADEKRQTVVDKYKTILGRNHYSQARRVYCFKKYSNGKYYSDCSSSIALSYREAGYPIRDKNGYTIPNTVGMYSSPDLAEVDVEIKDGVIQNPDSLRIGDLLLFAGTNASRKSADYVGHVEMVYRINGDKITICGHGSGRPRTTELNAYCKSRYKSKTSKTALGHKGLIRVMRRIQGDNSGDTEGAPEGVTSSEDSREAATAGSVAATAKPGQPTREGDENMKKIEVTGTTVNLRTGPGTQYEIAAVAKRGDVLDVISEQGGWVPVSVDGQLRWISGKYIKDAE